MTDLTKAWIGRNDTRLKLLLFVFLCFVVYIFTKSGSKEDRRATVVGEDASTIKSNVRKLKQTMEQSWYEKQLPKLSFLPTWRKQDTCVSGYLENFPSICGADGCLPVLPARDQVPEVPPMPVETRSRLLTLAGWMGEKNIDMVWYFTQAQREFGIYGSVGEIGVYQGRYSSVLAQWLDTEAGERMFACDLFSGKEFAHLKTVVGSRKEKYEQNLKKMGLSLYHEEEAKRIRLFQDTSVHLSKAAILEMDLPAFRLFSIDGGHLHPVPVLDMLFVSCIVRDGAVISVDDALSMMPNHQVYAALEQFFTYFGTDIWRPFVTVTKKLYLVQTSWYDRYLAWFQKHNVFKKLGATIERNPKMLFGTKYQYYKITLKSGESRGWQDV